MLNWTCTHQVTNQLKSDSGFIGDYIIIYHEYMLLYVHCWGVMGKIQSLHISNPTLQVKLKMMSQAVTATLVLLCWKWGTFLDYFLKIVVLSTILRELNKQVKVRHLWPFSMDFFFTVLQCLLFLFFYYRTIFRLSLHRPCRILWILPVWSVFYTAGGRRGMWQCPPVCPDL